jgi:hypothetical protein
MADSFIYQHWSCGSAVVPLALGISNSFSLVLVSDVAPAEHVVMVADFEGPLSVTTAAQSSLI